MKNDLKIGKRVTKFTCDLCGEEVTCPYFHDGKVYGYTCITKVKPGANRKKEKEYWVEALSFTTELLENGKTKITAKYQGGASKEGKFSDFHDGFTRFYCIYINNGKAMINLLKYEKGKLFIPIS